MAMADASIPSANGSDRGGNGRFAKGNPGGPGNPLGGKVEKLRAAALRALTPEKMTQIVAAQIRKALRGDTEAAKFCRDTCMGKPAQALQGAQKGLLGHILGVLLLAQHPQSQGIDPLFMAIG